MDSSTALSHHKCSNSTAVNRVPHTAWALSKLDSASAAAGIHGPLKAACIANNKLVLQLVMFYFTSEIYPGIMSLQSVSAMQAVKGFCLQSKLQLVAKDVSLKSAATMQAVKAWICSHNLYRQKHLTSEASAFSRTMVCESAIAMKAAKGTCCLSELQLQLAICNR